MMYIILVVSLLFNILILVTNYYERRTIAVERNCYIKLYDEYSNMKEALDKKGFEFIKEDSYKIVKNNYENTKTKAK